jgi:hypothetical protein
MIRTTDHHPFWNATARAFTYADALEPGDRLAERGGHLIGIRKVRIYRADVTAYNLTISGIHTYYVFAGHTPVLVHNSCPSGSEAGAQQLQTRAAQLNSQIPHGDWNNTTAAVRMWNPATNDTEVWIAINGDGAMPAAWTLNPGERFIPGAAGGHAEENIFSWMENDWSTEWEPIEGGTSRGVCTTICWPIINNEGMLLGGPKFRSVFPNSPWKLFWRP